MKLTPELTPGGFHVSADGSESAQNHPKTPLSTLIEPSRAVESRGHHPTTLPEGGAGDGG
jgi:hypothetical protein